MTAASDPARAAFVSAWLDRRLVSDISPWTTRAPSAAMVRIGDEVAVSGRARGLTGNVRLVSDPRSRGARVHARSCQGVLPSLRTIAASGLVLATQKPGSLNGQSTSRRRLLGRS